MPAQAFPAAARSPLILPAAPSPKALPASFSPSVLAIGVSTGGPAALDVLLPALPAGFPLPILIVQHMPELFTRLLAERLNGRCRMPVCEAGEGAPVRAGAIYIARGNWHMEVLAPARIGSSASLHLTQGPQVNHCRPAVDVLFRSVAAVYGSGVLALVLTGMGSDGLAGCRMIRDLGGCILAQDQPTSAVWGMPGAVANAGLAHRVLPLGAIATEILRLVQRTNREAREIRESVV
jgi:two-component system chemotaxis response regulator CheB